MKKKIFIAIHYLQIGGAERSLLGLLNAIDTDRYDVDLFLYQHSGEFIPFIPEKINLLPEVKRYTLIERPLLDVLREGYIIFTLARLFAKYRAKRYLKKRGIRDTHATFQYIAQLTTPLLPEIKSAVLYDLAISFLPPHNIVKDKVNSKKKLAWIHTDYTSIEISRAMEEPVWKTFDNIVAVSESVKTAFSEKFPSLSDKIMVFENILSPVFVREQSLLEDVSPEMPEENGVIKLLSIGRFSDAKNFDNIPCICKQIVQYGLDIKWYIIGYGTDIDKIKKSISDFGMDDKVILLGVKSNPYPYIRACDIYVQPSRYEGKAVTVREAQMLHKPVVITRFPTSGSQLDDRVDGLIIPMDNEGAAKGLIDFINNKDLQNQLINNLRSRDYGNENEVEKLYSLMN